MQIGDTKPDRMEGLRERLREARVAVGLSMMAAAEAADVSLSWYTHLETRRTTPPTVPELRPVLKALGLDADEVLREEGLL